VVALVMLGDFYQLPGVAGTNAKDSVFYKNVYQIDLHKSWRSGDAALLTKLKAIRAHPPKKQMRNKILRGHKAWTHPGPPSKWELRQLFRCHKKTTIVTCTRRGASKVNLVAADVLVGQKRTLATIPGDFDDNMENYDTHGKLRTDRAPVSPSIALKKGLRVHLTRNLDKKGDFVNGMEATVNAWDERSQCLRVTTKTGKALAVYHYTDPQPEHQRAVFFPIRLGYASTLYKMQGAELPHVTIWLDAKGQRAAAYVAMSRVRRDKDYKFGGVCKRKHFVPAL